jgi:FkbM family methyltransferase
MMSLHSALHRPLNRVLSLARPQQLATDVKMFGNLFPKRKGIDKYSKYLGPRYRTFLHAFREFIAIDGKTIVEPESSDGIVEWSIATLPNAQKTHMIRLVLHYSKRVCHLWHIAARHGMWRIRRMMQGTLTVRTRHGLLTVSTRDAGIGAPLYIRGQHDFDFSVAAVRFLQDKGFLPRTNLTMLDIGANIGVTSIGLIKARMVEKAIAIEPEPRNFELLRKNVHQNSLSKHFLCLSLAAGETALTLTMELSPNNLGDHRIRALPHVAAPEKFNESGRKTIQIQSLPLSEILELAQVRANAMPSPSLMWIDVQGYEGFVFKGAMPILRNGLPTVSEVWPYGILRAGMPLEEFSKIVRALWTDYWIERRNRFVRYPIAVFDRYLDELGTDENFEDVIFTKNVA